MKYSDRYIEKAKLNEIVKLETCFAEEQKYIWKNMVRIEKIKKENLSKKNLLLRQGIRAN